jgi:hypothetical protein
VKGAGDTVTKHPGVRCNGRKPFKKDLPKLDPGPWGGEGYCGRYVRGDGTRRCPTHRGRPVQHGRYSNVLKSRLSDLYDNFEADEDPLDILPEVALMRGILTDFLNRYEEFSGALIAWHQSFDEGDRPKKPTQILDLADGHKLLDTLSKMVERVEKAKSADAISRPDLLRVMQEMGRVVDHVLSSDTPPERQRAEIQKMWLSIKF